MKRSMSQRIRSFLYGRGIDIRYVSSRRRAEYLGLHEFCDRDVFMCSYPRSGNTWTRMIIAGLLDPTVERFDLELIDDLVPDAGQEPRRPVSVNVYKQHRADFDLFPRVIYNYRDGRDAIQSAFRYAVDALNYDGDMDTFLVDRSAQVFGYWHEHVQAALEFQTRYPERILMIPYEQIHDSPQDIIKRLAKFLRLPYDPARADTIIQQTHIDKVRNAAARMTDPRYSKTLNKGQVGGWRETLSPKHQKLFESMSGRILERLGYEVAPVENRTYDAG